jgi:predicted dehydrogenase
MTKRYRFAIMGTGIIARKMAEALEHVTGAVKYAVASREQGKAKLFATEWGFEKAYGSYQEMVNDPLVDVVYIALPHNLHCTATLLSLDAGKHVICEKPFAVNEAEVRMMIDKAQSKGLFLMEAMWSRFLPHIIRAKELVENGTLGHIDMLTADFAIRRRPIIPSDRKWNRELIGGALMDIGIYPVFIAQYLLGEHTGFDAQAVIGSTQVDYSCGVTFKYAQETMAITYSSFLVESGVKAAVYGSKTTLEFDSFWFMPGDLKLLYHDDREELIPFPKIGNGYHYEAQEVVDCLNKGLTQSPSMTWDDSLKLIQTLDGIRQKCGIFYPGHDKEA